MDKGERFSPLYTDYYELAMAQGYFKAGKAEKEACFDYFYRKLPFGNGYALFAGLKDLLNALDQYIFAEEELEYLRSLGMDQDFIKHLESFEFRGSIDAPKEGELIFPNEPVIRIRGTMLETQLIETLVLNIINFQSLIATKASRMRFVAGDRQIIDFGLRRAQGMGGIMASRAAIIGGADATSNVYSAKKYNIKPAGTMAHSWIESFEDELTAFSVFAQNYPENSILLVDTYDTLRSGVPNAITVAKEMKSRGQQLAGIRLDSGDLAYLSKQARKMLDDHHFYDVKIVASNQLDEYLIKSLLEQGAPIDGFGVGTNLVVGRKDAALDGVYKLTMFDGKPKLKISENVEKLLLPGVKKVLRYYDEEGFFAGDAVMLAEEEDPERIHHPFLTSYYNFNRKKFEPLLQQVVKNGHILPSEDNPYEIAKYANERLSMLRNEHKRFENPHIYKIGISEKLFSLRQELVDSLKPNNTV